jgi:glutamyl-tRNA reductase
MQPPELFVVGVTHRTAPLGVRERLRLSAEAEQAFAADLATLPGLAEFAVVNTCNRLEIYGVAAHAAAVERLAAAFCHRQGLAHGEFAPWRLDRRGKAATEHLLAVAAGLDSQMLGENEIFGQVKQAYAVAQERGSAGPVLNRVFQKIFQAAKHVRTHTAITSGLVSVANVAVDLAAKIFGDPARANILLLGAGDIGRKCGRAFLNRGAVSLTVSNRTPERALEVATELGIRALPFEHSAARLHEFDVVVCSTSAPTALISPAVVAAAMQGRSSRPIFFIDTAMPRDVEPAVARMENVFLYDLDDLARIAAENRTARQAEIVKCEALLAERATALWTQVERQLAPPAPAGAPAAGEAFGAACPA